MADLPEDRVTPGESHFSYLGIDCFGPYYVKSGQAQEKRYGCIFTCLAIRAIHLEVLHSMDADSFINALMRFIARRGVPKRIRSDNGTNFVCAERQLKEAIQDWNRCRKTRELLLLNSIEWMFNSPAASHTCVSWERLIRSVRKTLNSITLDQDFADERLTTIFCEV